MINKIQNYDKFKCTGDRCKYTCCTGWNIEVDKDTYSLWQTKHKSYLSEVKSTDDEHFINKKTRERCPFQEESGLCGIINENGHEAIPKGCQSFPRIENKLGDSLEYSLNFACLEVVDLVSKVEGKINIPNPTGLREKFLKILDKEWIPLEERLVILFKMVGERVEGEDLEKYNDESFIKTLVDDYSEIEWDTVEGIGELNRFFLDIIENYKRVPLFRELLGELQTFVKRDDLEYISLKWQGFKNEFCKHNLLIENILKSKIYSNCCYEEEYEVALSLQLILLEYLLFKYASFLNWFSEGNREVSSELLKEYIMAFSRIVGNNRDAMIDFIEDEFGEGILDFEYLEGLLLF